MNLLLSGPPGTGKTEFAKYVAHHLDKDLIVKRASDLLSMWVGQAEKNIAKMFREAQRDGAVLFIDEADSLFYAREMAQRSWEVSQTNELLCQMEAFRGILICATNFGSNLDSASIRRFNLKLKFDYLTDEGKEAFFSRLVAPMMAVGETTAELVARLRGMGPLTPGDFKIVRQKFAFLPREEITGKVVLGALEAEVGAKANVVGRSSGFGGR